VLEQQLPAPSAWQQRARIRSDARECDESAAITGAARAHEITYESALSAQGHPE